MANYPNIVEAGPTPPPILPPRVQPVAPPSPKKAALLSRIAQLKRQVVISSIVAFAVVVGFISGAWGSVGSWVSQQFFSASATQQTDSGSNFFNQGNNSDNSGGNNVGTSGGQSPSSGTRGS
jgi:uncharacterized membrane protein YgcG